jgi:hypothetical protein
MEDSVDRVYAYGIAIDAGSFECVDCDHRHDHAARGPLPPCPLYRDSTHARSAWRAWRDREAHTEKGSPPSG